MKRVLLPVILVLMLCSDAFAGPIVMKIAHGNSANIKDPYQALCLKFKEAVEQRTDNITIKIFPGGQLGAEQRAFQDVQNGILQGAVLASNNVSAFATSISILDLPFLFRSNAEFESLIKECNEDFARVMKQESDTIPLAWGVQGFRVLSNSKKAVSRIDDLRGLKIRVPNNAVQVATFRAWGCDAVPMAFGELFGALQQRVVDGLEMTYISLGAQKMYEVQNYVTDLRYKLAINPLVVSAQWFEGLPESEQKALVEAGREATAYAMELASQMDEEGKQMLVKGGVTLSPQPEDEDVWVEKAKTVWPMVFEQVKDQQFKDKVLSALKVEG